MLEWAELWRKTGQRSLLIASYNRLEKRLCQGRNSCGGDCPCPWTLGFTRVPASQAAAPPSCSSLPGTELPEAKKRSCIYAHRVALVVPDSLWPCRLWPARLLCLGGGFSRQECWSILSNTGCHSLLEHCISCCPSRQLPWVPGAARTLQPKHLHHLHSMTLTGQTQVLQGSLRSKLQGLTHMQRWK